MLLLGFCLFRTKMADLAQKVYERKSVAPAQQTDNERKEFLAGTTVRPVGRIAHLCLAQAAPLGQGRKEFC